MPKPVLSDSLFNANDVATAVLDFAELSVTNQDFAVSEVADLITASTGFTHSNTNFYTFNGFAFVSLTIYGASGVSHNDVLGTIKAGYEPNTNTVFPVIGYQGDNANYLRFDTNGNLTINSPDNVSDPQYYITVNGVYRFA